MDVFSVFSTFGEKPKPPGTLVVVDQPWRYETATSYKVQDRLRFQWG